MASLNKDTVSSTLHALRDVARARAGPGASASAC